MHLSNEFHALIMKTISSFSYFQIFQNAWNVWTKTIGTNLISFFFSLYLSYCIYFSCPLFPPSLSTSLFISLSLPSLFPVFQSPSLLHTNFLSISLCISFYFSLSVSPSISVSFISLSPSVWTKIAYLHQSLAHFNILYYYLHLLYTSLYLLVSLISLLLFSYLFSLIPSISSFSVFLFISFTTFLSFSYQFSICLS